MSTQQPLYTTDAEHNDDDIPNDDIDADNSDTHDTIKDEEDTLLAINSDLNRSRSAVSDTYRGYYLSTVNAPDNILGALSITQLPVKSAASSHSPF
jgi:hypothetical protein